MVDHLSDLIPTFSGSNHRVRCYAHVLNLVVAAIFEKFDSKKLRTGSSPGARALAELTDCVEEEEGEMRMLRDDDELGDEDPELPDDEDEEDDEDDEEEEEREKRRPVPSMLAKVSLG
jgi:hypothetical protein